MKWIIVTSVHRGRSWVRNLDVHSRFTSVHHFQFAVGVGRLLEPARPLSATSTICHALAARRSSSITTSWSFHWSPAMYTVYTNFCLYSSDFNPATSAFVVADTNPLLCLPYSRSILAISKVHPRNNLLWADFNRCTIQTISGAALEGYSSAPYQYLPRRPEVSINWSSETSVPLRTPLLETLIHVVTNV